MSETIDVQFAIFAFLKVLVHYLMHYFFFFEISGLWFNIKLVDAFRWSILALERLWTNVGYNVHELFFWNEGLGSLASPDDVTVVEGLLLLEHMDVVDKVRMSKAR
jgi:hypothetical protein